MLLSIGWERNATAAPIDLNGVTFPERQTRRATTCGGWLSFHGRAADSISRSKTNRNVVILLCKIMSHVITKQARVPSSHHHRCCFVMTGAYYKQWCKGDGGKARPQRYPKTRCLQGQHRRRSSASARWRTKNNRHLDRPAIGHGNSRSTAPPVLTRRELE